MKFATPLIFICCIFIIAAIGIGNERSDINAEFDAKQTIVQMNWVRPDDPELDNIWGKASFHYDEETHVSICIITTARPNKIDDFWVAVLGHEMLHCLYGAYHEE